MSWRPVNYNFPRASEFYANICLTKSDPKNNVIVNGDGYVQFAAIPICGQTEGRRVCPVDMEPWGFLT